jgi:hypothetical protein
MYLTKDNETVEEAKARLQAEQQKRKEAGMKAAQERATRTTA